MRTPLIIAAVNVAALLTVAGQAQAQLNRSFVSGHGADTNPCSLAAPCRTFTQAITQTNAGGEIVVLDSAGYGPVTITQSVTITNPGGVEAGITTQNGQSAITINTTAAASVTLRGLTLQGDGVGQNGINLVSSLPNGTGPNNLNIIDCVIKDFAGNGIAILPTGTGLVGALVWNVVIDDSTVLQNTATGIKVATQQAAGANVYIYRSVVDGNGAGISGASNFIGADVLVSNSHVDNNGGAGITVGTQSAFRVRSSTVQGNGSIQATNDIVNNNFLTLVHGNDIGVINNPGTADTDGTNNIGSQIGSGNPLVKVGLQ